MNSHQRRKQFRLTKKEFPIGQLVTLKYAAYFDGGKVLTVSRHIKVCPEHVQLREGSCFYGARHINTLVKILA